MKVTDDMITESGIPLAKTTDFLDEYGTGVQVTRTGDAVVIEVGTGEYPSRKLWLLPSDVYGLMEKLKEVADETHELYPDEEKVTEHPWLRRKGEE